MARKILTQGGDQWDVLPMKPERMIPTDCDTKMPESKLSKLPKLSELPADWELIALHILYDQLKLGKTTLPTLWEQSAGPQERLIVVWPHMLVDYPASRMMCYVCDAMPGNVARQFVRWLDGQTFVSRQQKFYAESTVTTYEQPYPMELYKYLGHAFPWRFHVAGIDTNRCTISALSSLVVPLQFRMFKAKPEVVDRFNIVMNDPIGLIKA